MSHTLAEKILLSHCDADDVRPGEVVMARCDLVMANDVSGPVAFRALEKMGATEVFDPAKVVMVADHFMPAKDARSAGLQKRLKDWSDAHGVTFYAQGRGGIEHTLLCEEGWIRPGTIVAGGDSHTCTYGAVGAFGTGLGSTDIAACLAFGEFWQAVPTTIRVEFTGEKRRFVTGKDLILAVIDQIGVGGGTNAVLEFVGPGAEALSIDERLAVANMAVEAGAETGLFGADETTAAYLDGHGAGEWVAERSDPDAEFARLVRVDLDGLPPLIALPHLPGNVAPVSDVAGTKIDQVYIGNCANGTMTDLRQTASILRGRSIHSDCRMIVVPATQRIYRQALAEGLLDLFVEAGAMVSTPTCGACFGGGMGVLGAGERAIDHQPQLPRPDGLARRRGAPGQRVRGRGLRRRRRDHRPRGAGRVIIEGRAVVIDGDNVDTDVMYPGEFLNIEDPDAMKAHLFEGYDPALRDQLGEDAVIVTGWNFGIGSSREHVPLAMKAWGVRCVLGKSFARIFRRNCVNLGLLALACPDAVEAVGPETTIRIDTDSGSIAVDGQTFEAEPVPGLVRELQDAGGLVEWAQRRTHAG
jgi:3-isopropylmalate/(R)-2-methylmalate dehydratase large subunit